MLIFFNPLSFNNKFKVKIFIQYRYSFKYKLYFNIYNSHAL